MVLQTKDFQSVVRTILFAIDTKDTSLINETLELKAANGVLQLNVTNREYYVSINFDVNSDENFKASVKAKLFLNLISKLTTDTITLTVDQTNINIKANGEYKIPLIFNNDTMLELPTIEIKNVTNEMSINSSILHSIANYNSKELTRGVMAKPVQKYYYVDELGAITFVTGACVNSFTLEKPIKMLLSDKVIKLSKLFKPGCDIKFTMGQDQLSDELIQTKVQFKGDNVTLTAKLTESHLITSVPVSAIRGMAESAFDYSLVVDKNELLQSIQRLLLFNDEANRHNKLVMKKDSITIFDSNLENKEVISVSNECESLKEYSMFLDLSYLKSMLDGVEDEFITISFGNKRSAVIKKSNITDITLEYTE